MEPSDDLAIDDRGPHRGETALLRRLVEVLGHERSALETLVYRCRVAALILGSPHARHAAQAGDDVDHASTELGALDAVRAVVVTELAEVWDLDAGVTLGELVDRAPEPYDRALGDLEVALVDLRDELTAVQAMGAHAGRRALARIEERAAVAAAGGAAGYGADAAPTARTLVGSVRARL